MAADLCRSRVFPARRNDPSTIGTIRKSDECRNFAEGHRRVCGPWPTFRADNRERAKLFQTSRRWSLDRPRFLPDESSSLRKAVSRRAEVQEEIEKEKKIIVQQKGQVPAVDNATGYYVNIVILAISISPIPINKMLANSYRSAKRWLRCNVKLPCMEKNLQ
ncbi:hypothetical protein G5I_14247 [Acromyrmex echinatior]|uniref:Uncharacterized protein n=1 Tax=Acromyrmex echinatior TaxID=103372 RepID=F4X7A8_ACREC|nr:hypothetical protein G5I_14247 [Acromyrmex echinatior]